MKLTRWCLLLAFAVSGFAAAQSNVLIHGENTDASPATIKKVAVDAQGRVKVVNSGSTSSTCSATASKNVTVGTTATPVPATTLTNRVWLRICNSLRNAGNPMVTCATSVTPTVASSSAGDTLLPGDCAVYPINASITPSCISDTASTAITTEECAGS